MGRFCVRGQTTCHKSWAVWRSWGPRVRVKLYFFNDQDHTEFMVFSRLNFLFIHSIFLCAMVLGIVKDCNSLLRHHMPPILLCPRPVQRPKEGMMRLCNYKRKSPHKSDLFQRLQHLSPSHNFHWSCEESCLYLATVILNIEIASCLGDGFRP